jgi:hypothetical protein
MTENRLGQELKLCAFSSPQLTFIVQTPRHFSTFPHSTVFVVNLQMPLPQIGDALFVDLPRVRLDGGAKAFRQRWGYELSPPPPLLEEEEGEGCEAEGEGEPAETASLREEGTVHTVSPLGEFREQAAE